MPVYLLGHEPVFPSPHLAEPDGLLAVGGSLSPEWLLSAYVQGIFPWFNSDDDMLWWSPDPRLVLMPHELNVHNSLKQVLRNRGFELRCNTNFEGVISRCSAAPRRGQNGTWLTPEMQQAYLRLHHLGWAHSIETYFEGMLVGGLYGLAMGKAFFGESMFSAMPNASKVALVHLCTMAVGTGISFIDCQATTTHLRFMGAREMPRKEFLALLKISLKNGIRRWQPTPTEVGISKILNVNPIE
jgi:leucyl/phenylalanyl-tRNA--protein transferase